MKLDLITNKAKKEGKVNPNDEYYTPIYAIEPIVEFLKEGSTIWCPFDTKDSNYYKYLTEKGFNVICTHIEKGQDFLSIEPSIIPQCDYIISNPPYSLKNEVFEKLYEIGKPFAMLVGVVGIFESQRRFNLFKNNRVEVLYFNKRVSYFKDYSDQKPSLNPPFSSVYLCSSVLPNQIEFREINK